LVPLFNPFKNSWVELPIGDRIPVPVTTTRLDIFIFSSAWSKYNQLLDQQKVIPLHPHQEFQYQTLLQIA